jgi:hypothetical protein
MTSQAIPPIYLLHIWIRQISPMIWRRVLVRSDSTLAQLHDVIQVLFDWSDDHLHRFRIHGRDYAGPQPCHGPVRRAGASDPPLALTYINGRETVEFHPNRRHALGTTLTTESHSTLPNVRIPATLTARRLAHRAVEAAW